MTQWLLIAYLVPILPLIRFFARWDANQEGKQRPDGYSILNGVLLTAFWPVVAALALLWALLQLLTAGDLPNWKQQQQEQKLKEADNFMDGLS